MRACLLALLLLASSAGASSNWLGSVHLPPKSAVLIPGTADAWPTDAWSLEWWQLAAPRATAVIDAGVLDWGCAASTCTAVVRGDAGGMIALAVSVYPYSVYAVRVEAELTPTGIRARLLLSGRVVAEGELAGESFAPAEDLMVYQRPGRGHLWILPLRLWRTAHSPPWLFGDPAPTDPELVGQWRTAADVTLVGAEPAASLCWEDGRLSGFRDGFESGDASRWTVVG